MNELRNMETDQPATDATDQAVQAATASKEAKMTIRTKKPQQKRTGESQVLETLFDDEDRSSTGANEDKAASAKSGETVRTVRHKEVSDLDIVSCLGDG